MCGRFGMLHTWTDMFESYNLISPALNLQPRFNIAPTQPVFAITASSEGGGNTATHFQWGLVPSWAKDVSIGAKTINARAETVSEKPAFRAVFRRRRCLIPASGFYEWQTPPSESGRGGPKQPFWIAAAQVYLPRMFHWTFGQFMWPWSWLIQGADILGSAGLNLIFIPLQLVLYGWVKTVLGDPPASRKEMAAASAIVALLLAASALYGQLRLTEMAESAARGNPLRVVAVQPNFSLARLASNPALSHSDREGDR